MNGDATTERTEGGRTEGDLDNVRPIDPRRTEGRAHPPIIATAVEPPKRGGGVAKRVLLIILPLVVLGLGGREGLRWWEHDRFFVETDDAYVTAEITWVAAKIAGHVSEIAVRANQHVEAGEVIARIDDGDYRLAIRAANDKLASGRATVERVGRQIEAARATVGQTAAQLESARATLRKAEGDFTRQSELSANRYASVATADSARAARDTAAAAVTAAEAGLAQAKTNVTVVEAQRAEAEGALRESETTLAKAERDLSFTEIKAPVDGVVGTHAVEVGAYVAAGTRIVPIIADDGYHLDANFKETQLANIRPGAPVEVRLDAYPDRVFTARVASLSPGTGAVFSLLPPENATGNFTKIVQRLPVRLDVDDPDHLLRSGLSAAVAVDTRG